MLALGQWFIDKKANKIFNINNENQPLNLEEQAVELLIFLAEQQHKLIDKHTIIKHLWPSDDQEDKTINEQLLQQLITAITHQLGNNVITITPDHYYLLQLSTFDYQYTPITIAQMKRQLAEKQLIEHKKAQQALAQSSTQQSKASQSSTSSSLNRPNNHTPVSTVKKVLLVTIVALMISAFLAAS